MVGKKLINESAGVLSQERWHWKKKLREYFRYKGKASFTIANSGQKILVQVNHTEKLHFCFLAAKCYRIYSFPLETIHLPEPAHEHPGNEEVSLIFIAFILNSCSGIQYIAVIYDFPF